MTDAFTIGLLAAIVVLLITFGSVVAMGLPAAAVSLAEASLVRQHVDLGGHVTLLLTRPVRREIGRAHV